MIDFRNIGLVPYKQAWELQRELFEKKITAKKNRVPSDDYVLFCEHPSVYTLGKSGKQANMLVSKEWLWEKGAEFYHIERGGDVTFHGEGQLVVYPILDLEQLHLGLREYIWRLEEAIIRTITSWGIYGERIEGASGVWIKCRTTDDRQQMSDGDDCYLWRKICAIGVKSSHYVTMHGAALNVNTDLRWFEYINPCGFTDKGVTSMAREVGHEVNMTDVADTLKTELAILLESI